MNWFKIFTLIATVITFLAFLYQTYLFVKTKSVYEGIWAVMFWVALMTIS
jgi:uncharacterized protein with PQ loop repeat